MSLHYTPAGAEMYSSSGQLFVNYKPSTKEETQFGSKYKRWQLKDRILTLTSITEKGGILAPERFNQMVGINDGLYVQTCGLTKVLANPIHRPFNHREFASRNIECIVDSGGFQMLKGIIDFVDPNEVIERYNQCADIGMPLDLPIRASDESTFFHAVSKLIKANDDYIIPRLNKGIDLALISHGTTLERRKARLDVLDRDAKVIAIAGLNIKPKAGVDHHYNIVENLMYVTHRYRKQARHFHVLGVTSKLWMFIYALLSESNYVKSIGADSVSHRLSALVGNYELHDFTTIEIPKALNYRRSPPCDCPVCHTVGDLRVMNNTVLLEAHNLWVMAKRTETIREMAYGVLNDTVKLKEVHDLLRLTFPINKLNHMVTYVRELIASGKYKPMKSDAASKGLFGNQEIVNTGSDATKEHCMKVLRNYEKFHKKKFL